MIHRSFCLKLFLYHLTTSIFGNFIYLCTVMRIFTKGTLAKFWNTYPDAYPSLKTWFDVVEETDFKTRMK